MSTSRSPHRSMSSIHNHVQVPLTESLILPSGPVGEEAAELLGGLVRPQHPSEEELLQPINTSEDERENLLDYRKRLPWWKRPSPWWLLALYPFTAIGMSATLAPRIEIYTILACNVHKPEYTANFDLSSAYSPFYANNAGELAALPSALYNFSRDPVMIWNNTSSSGQSPSTCASDPVVQAAVAKLTTVMTASMGVLGCLTTGWWGSFSDRHGRLRVMGISVLGVLLTDFNFIFVSMFARHLPGNYWFLVIGPIIEGSLGGLTSAAAAMHAYLADCTDVTSRSRMFSLSLGLMFTGIALGPTLGGLLIHVTQQVISVFYAATVIHLLYAIVVWALIPESLTSLQMATSRRKHAVEMQQDLTDTPVAVSILVRLKRMFKFLSPLFVFIPEKLEKGRNVLKTQRRDWSLSLLAASYGCTMLILGSFSYKFQYAASAFGWSSEIIGYWLSLVGATRAFYLTIVLPIIIKLLKPKPIPIQLAVEPSEPLHSHASATSSSAGPSSSGTPSPNEAHLMDTTMQAERVHSSIFDLALARVSLCSDMIFYSLLALFPTPLAFTLFTMASSLGAGFSPALQSVALELYSRRGGTESGRLFGALSVVQALSSQILGPAIFGFTYMKTVATAPRAIFFLTVAATLLSFILVSLVRLPKNVLEDEIDDVEGHANREETLVAIPGDDGTPTDRGGQVQLPAIVVSEPRV